MGENDDLKILIEAALDFAKSMQNITRQLGQLQSQLNTYRLKITAGLDQATTASQIRQDLSKINNGKPKINLVGRMDRNATKAELEKTVKSIKGVEVKLSTALDPLEAGKQLQSSLPNAPSIEASANVKVDGAEQVDKLSQQLESAENNAAGMASKVYLARTALQLLRRTVKEAIDTVTELDTCITDLSVATGQNRDETYKLLEGYNELAEKMGTTTSQIARAADEWLRQGHSLADTTVLIEDAMVLSKISQIDSANATQYLTSAMKGYKIAAQDVLGVVDKLSAVDLVSATNAGELAEAMSRTAVTANMAGISMDRLLGYLAATGEVTQKSMSSIGEGYKTIFSRMNDIKANKLQLVDEDGTEETLSDVELTLKNVGIDLRATVNEYNNYGDVLDSLAAKWSTLSEVQQNALVKAFAGTRQSENFRVLMENYSSATEYMQVAADSAGTALDKFSVYEESIEAKAASFTAAMENLTMDTVDSDFVKDLIDVDTAVVDFIDKIGLLKSALISLGAGGILKGISVISGGFRAAYKDVTNLGEAITTLRSVDDLGADTIAKLGTLTAGLNDEQIKLVLTSTQLSTAQMQAILTAGGLTSEEAAQKIATLGLATSQETATETTVSLSGAMTGLRAKIKGTFAGMSTVGKVVSAVSLVTTAVSIGVSIWQSYKRAQEEARQAAVQAAEEYEQSVSSIEEYKDKVTELKGSLDEGNLSEQEAYEARRELMSIQDEVIKTYGKEAGAIDLVSSSADDAVKALDKLTVALANENLTKQASEIDDAIEEMEKTREIEITIGGTNNDQNVFGAIEKAVSKYENASIEYPSVFQDGSKWAVLHIDANATDARETINGLAADFRDIKKQFEDDGIDIDKVFPAGSTFAERFEDATADVDEVIDKWKEIYDAQIQWKIVTDDNYSDAMTKITGVGEAMEEALASGSSKALAAAIEDVDALDGLLDPDKIDDDGVRGYMQELIDELQAEALRHTVEVKLSADVDDDWMRKVRSALSYLQGGDGQVSVSEVKSAGVEFKENDGHAVFAGSKYSSEAYAYLSLARAAEEYGLNMEKLLPILVKYGLVVDDTVSAQEKQAKSAEALEKDLAAMKDAYDLLGKSAAEMASDGGLSAGTVQSIMEKLSEDGEDYLDFLYEENGAVKLNTAAWTEYIAAKRDAAGAGEGGIAGAVAESLTKEAAQQVFDSALQRLQKLHEALDRLRETGALDLSAYEELTELMPEAAGSITDAESAQEVLAAAIEKGEEAARKAYRGLLMANQDWVDGALEASDTLTRALEQVYGVDYDNWTKLADGKWAVDKSLVESLSELWQKYQGMSDDELKTSIARLRTLERNRNKVAGIMMDAGIPGKQYTGGLSEEEQKELNDLEAALALRRSLELQWDELSKMGFNAGSGSSGSSKSVEKYVADIEAFRKAIEDLRKAQEDRTGTEERLDATDDLRERIKLEGELISDIAKEQSAQEELDRQRREAIAAQAEKLREMGFAVRYNAEADDFFVENLEHLNELVRGGTEDTNEYRKETEELIETLEEWNESNREGAENQRELAEQVKSARASIIDDLKEIAAQASNVTDELQNVKTTLVEALREYDENGGKLSLDTYQSVLELGPQYLSLLRDENGELELNRERIDGVLRAKAEEMAVETAWSYVERVRLALLGQSNESLAELVDGIRDAAGTTWELVYANAELLRTMGLSDEGFESVIHNLETIRKLGLGAAEGIDGVAGDGSELYTAEIDKYREAKERLRREEERNSNLERSMDLTDDLREQVVLQRRLESGYQRQQQALHELNDQRDADIQKNVEELRRRGFEVRYNAETNELWIDDLERLNTLQAESAEGYENIAEAASAYRQETEELIAATEQLNEENREGSASWWELEESVRDAHQRVFELLGEVYTKSAESVDKLQSVYSALHEAAEDYASTGGVALDTLQSILELGPQYLSYLMDEEGQLYINEERIRDLIKAKTEEMAVSTALAYVEALRIAKLEGDNEALEELLQTTQEATDAQWGFVYASLQYAGLSDSEYKTALDNVNAIRALSESAAESYGKNAEGVADIMEYVQELIKQQVQDQVDAINEMVDAYQEYIDAQKEALDNAREQDKYERSKKEKLREIAKLQAQIDILGLDDSREAQAERAALQEKMAELQEDLNDTQADKAVETQKEALDKMSRDYADAKQEEIDELEGSISSEQKLYDKAVEYISSNWDTLKSELLAWNYEVGSNLQDEICSAWDAALESAERYGGYVSALKATGNYHGDWGGGSYEPPAASGSGSGSGSGNSAGKVGNTVYDTASSWEQDVGAILTQMHNNMVQWHDAAPGEEVLQQGWLANENQRLSEELKKLGINAHRENGIWYDEDGEELFKRYAKYIKTYHTGGIVGGGTAKDREQFALLKEGEWVLNDERVKNLAARLEYYQALGKIADRLPDFTGTARAGNIARNYRHLTENVVNNTNRPVEINFGGTTINGASGADALARHVEVDRRMVNEIARVLKVR